MRLAISGANGFIGRRLCQYFSSSGHTVTALTRRHTELQCKEQHVISDFSNSSALSNALKSSEVLIHLAGIAHNYGASKDEYFRVNVSQTLSMANAAVASGVKQFIYFSSIKVNGEYTEGAPFKPSDRPNPRGHYAESKWHAEIALQELCALKKIHLVIIRPTLVYDDRPKGNLRILSWAIRFRIPLPLLGINNKRQLLSIENLAKLLNLCFLNNTLDKKVLLLADKNSLSTTQIVGLIAKTIGRKPILINCPKKIKPIIKKLPITSNSYKRLFYDLEVDTSETEELTGWTPTSTKL